MKTTLYLSTAEGLNVVTSSGDRWYGKAYLRGTQLQCVAVSQADDQSIFCGSFGQGIYSSRDGGTTWTQSPGLANSRVTALEMTAKGRLYAGTEPSALYVSDDSGSSWRELQPLDTLPSAPTWSFPPRPETHHVQAIKPVSGPRKRLLVAIEAGALVTSADGGLSWKDRVPGGPADTHSLAVNPTDPQHVCSAAGDGFFESRDGGESWQCANQGLRQTYCWSVAVSRAPAPVLLLTASEHAFTAHNQQIAKSFVYRRSATGLWELAMNGLAALSQARIPVIAAGPLEPATFYLATEGTLYRSRDSGLSWEELLVQWDERGPIRRHSLCIAVTQKASR